MKCELVEKTSKAGKKYIVLQVHLTPSYSKDVFLDNAEIELITLYGNQQQNKN